MTIEERAQLMVEERVNLKPWEGTEELKARFVQHLRDQIEECAKVAGEHANRIALKCSYLFIDREGDNVPIPVFYKKRYEGAWLSAIGIEKKIRALAGPTEEGKENHETE